MGPEGIATRFVAARRAARALEGFPGETPGTLNEAYEIQERAIALWDDGIAGWKIGRIPTPALQAHFGDERLCGPIFRHAVRQAVPGQATVFPIFPGGFAAVEAELVFRIAHDADPDKLDWSPDEAAALVGEMFGGVETAGSPLATINELGPAVVISDFGNNAGLILGPEIAGWRERDPATLTCETFVEGVSVGRGGALSLPGRPLKAGQYVSTGAATGIHDILHGQSCEIVFPGHGAIACRAVAAQPMSAP